MRQQGYQRLPHQRSRSAWRVGAGMLVAAVFIGMPIHADDNGKWRERAETMIEKHRKAEFSIRVVDRNGQPVPSARVEAAMTRHAFGFGTAINANLLSNQTDDDNPYRRHLPELFNVAVIENAMKWKYFERPNDRETVAKTVRWLLDHKIRVRGHTMLWQTFKYGVPMPKDVEEMAKSGKPEAAEWLRTRSLEHIAAIGRHYRDQVFDWDVLNEQVSEHELTKVINPGVPLTGAPVMVEWFKAAKKATAPGTRLIINDFHILVGNHEGHRDKYQQIIRYLLAEGAPLGGIGFQGHFYNAKLRNSPDRLYEILDRFAAFGLPLIVTEFDMFGGDWGGSTDEVERTQAEFLREFYTVLFSHPAVDAILMWGFWDGCHWAGQAPLFRKDWTPKAACHTYRELVFGEWWTKQSLVSDRDGAVAFRGFKGDYEITVIGPDGVRTTKPFTGDRNREIQIVLGGD